MCDKLKLNALHPSTTVLFMCDFQKKFQPVMTQFDAVLENSKKLITGCQLLDIPLLVTEQYPQGLGNTVSGLNISHAVAVVPKTKFTMWVPELQEEFQPLCNGSAKSVVLFGIETHVCIEQTAIDLLSQGLHVHIVADCCTSREQEDRLLALQRLQQIGCFITTSECVLFKLLADKDHPKFKEISKLVRTTSVSSGLTLKSNI